MIVVVCCIALLVLERDQQFWKLAIAMSYCELEHLQVMQHLRYKDRQRRLTI